MFCLIFQQNARQKESGDFHREVFVKADEVRQYESVSTTPREIILAIFQLIYIRKEQDFNEVDRKISKYDSIRCTPPARNTANTVRYRVYDITRQVSVTSLTDS